MTESDVRSWISLTLVACGILLYVLVHAWTPTEVVLGPVQLGSSSGDCHGLKSADGAVYAEVCK